MIEPKIFPVAAQSRSRPTAALNRLHGVRLVLRGEGMSGSEVETYVLEDIDSQAPECTGFLLRSKEGCGTETLQSWEQFTFRALWDQRPYWLGWSIPPCHGDYNWIERIANVLTSIPFIFIGLQAPRNKLVTKLYANSIVGIGLTSSLYHGTRGEARKIFRHGDHTMIATSAVCLTRALRGDNCKVLTAVSAALLPFRPALVTVIHTGLMEATFAQRAQAEPQLRKVHTMHAASSLIGCALFIADDVFPQTPFLHAAWHVAGAIAVATCIKLLE
eukprot:c21174_g1_i1 orf=243-1064(-)